MKNNLAVLTLAVVSAAILSGCVAYGEAYIPEPPPARVEVYGVAPFPDAIWVPGYWNWHRWHREYRWEPGRWGRPGKGRGKWRGREHEYEPRR